MKKVKFVKNNYVTVMNDKLAKVYSDKGKVKIIGEVKAEERDAAPKKEEPKGKK